MLLQRIQNCLKEKTNIANAVKEGLKAPPQAYNESTSTFILIDNWESFDTSLTLDQSPLFDLCFSQFEKLKDGNQFLVFDFSARIADYTNADRSQDGFKLTRTPIFDDQAILMCCSTEKALDEFEHAEFDEFHSLFSESSILAGITSEQSTDVELLCIAMQIYHLLDKDIKLRAVKTHFSMQPESVRKKEYTQGQLELCCQIGCLFKLMTEVKKPYQAQPASNGLLSWLSGSSSSAATSPEAYSALINNLLEEIRMNSTGRMVVVNAQR